jgi:hypothetical protein
MTLIVNTANKSATADFVAKAEAPSGEKRRRVLIVVSAYAPAMAADMHRARHLAWELPALGWDVEILCPEPLLHTAEFLDNDSGGFFPDATLVHISHARFDGLLRMAGARSAAWRAVAGMAIDGLRLLRSRTYDLVYFSTTSFVLLTLGPLWKRLSGVPYVVDIQDPIFQSRSRNAGSRLLSKRNLALAIMKQIEALSLNRAAAIVSVSPTYIDQLRQRYAGADDLWSRHDRLMVSPFAVLKEDFEVASRPQRTAGPGPLRITYVGVGGNTRRRAFDLLCQLLIAARREQPEAVDAVRFELAGTDVGWRPGDPCYLADLARERGLDAAIVELPRRVTYRHSLELLAESDGALILGVDDGGYMPSKLFPYAYSGKPVLAILKRGTPGFETFKANPSLGQVLWFDGAEEISPNEGLAVLKRFLSDVKEGKDYDRRPALEPFMAPAMAKQHTILFERILLGSDGERARRSPTTRSLIR